MKIIADTHTHSMACDHAYSTIAENIAAAAKKGLRFLALTEHGPAMKGAPTVMHFNNMRCLPRVVDGVTILIGAEANIMDDKGGLDLPESTISALEWVIASMHIITWAPSDEKTHTAAWIAIANNPHVDVIGHCGDSRYPFEYRTVIKEFARTRKIVEINSHSFGGRPGSEKTCPEIARLLAEYGVRIVVSSDAHFHNRVGDFKKATDMLEEIGFPEELILNADYDRFSAEVNGDGYSYGTGRISGIGHSRSGE